MKKIDLPTAIYAGGILADAFVELSDRLASGDFNSLLDVYMKYSHKVANDAGIALNDNIPQEKKG
jgi:hypothetical protein